MNNKTLALPFALGGCSLPSWVPAGAAASFVPVTVNASLSLGIPAGISVAAFATTLFKANQMNGGAMETQIAASLSVAPNAVTIFWAQLMGGAANGRRLLQSSLSIPYSVTTTAAAAATVQTSVSSFNPTTALPTTFFATLGVPNVVASAPAPPPPAKSPAAKSAAVAASLMVGLLAAAL